MVQDQTVPPQTAVGAKQGCTHFWLIDTPAGPTSPGQCKRCGEVKEFPNSLTEFQYGDDEPPPGVPTGTRNREAFALEAEE